MPIDSMLSQSRIGRLVLAQAVAVRIDDREVVPDLEAIEAIAPQRFAR
jgi:hypothetical protein